MLFLMILFVNKIIAELQCYIFVYLIDGTSPYTNIQVDLDLNETQYGLLGSIFTLISSISGLMMGYLSDRLSSRKWIFLVCSLITNIMTGLSYFSHNFVQILLPRIVAAITVSAITPISVSLINDYFNKETLGRANSIYVFGMYLGFSMSSLVILVDR